MSEESNEMKKAILAFGSLFNSRKMKCYPIVWRKSVKAKRRRAEEKKAEEKMKRSEEAEEEKKLTIRNETREMTKKKSIY